MSDDLERINMILGMKISQCNGDPEKITNLLEILMHSTVTLVSATILQMTVNGMPKENALEFVETVKDDIGTQIVRVAGEVAKSAGIANPLAPLDPNEAVRKAILGENDG
jgi:hypothetical protein